MVDALAILREEGYELVSLSGGEPLLYRGVADLVDKVLNLGYAVNIVTNGTLTTNSLARETLVRCSFVAVSIDGLADRHDRIRRRVGAFRQAQEGLVWLGDAGIPFGITATVTSESLPEVPELYDWAVEATESQLLSLRPLAIVGRAQREMFNDGLNQAGLARLLLLASLLDSEDSRMRVHSDILPAKLLREATGSAFPAIVDQLAAGSLSDLVNPLVVTERGTFLPFAYGVSPAFQLGVVAKTRSMIDEVRRDSRPIHCLINSAMNALPDSGVLDWHSHLTHISYVASSLTRDDAGLGFGV